MEEYLFGKKRSPIKRLQSFEEKKPVKVDYKDTKQKEKAFELSKVVENIKGFFNKPKPPPPVKPKKVYPPIKYKLFSPNSDPNREKPVRGKNLSPGEKVFNYKDYKEQQKNLLLLKAHKMKKYNPDFQPVLYKIAKKGKKAKRDLSDKNVIYPIKESKNEDLLSISSADKNKGVFQNIKHKFIDLFGNKKEVKKGYISDLIKSNQKKYSPVLKPVKYEVKYPSPPPLLKHPSPPPIVFPKRIKNEIVPKIVVRSPIKTKKEKKVVECPPGKIYNPETERCVKADGKIGKLLAKNKMSPLVKVSREKKEKCPSGKVFNPETGRCVKKDSKLGKKILGLA